MELAHVLNVLLMMAGLVAIPSLAYLGIRAGMATVKGMEADAALKATQTGGGEQRIAEREQRLAELEERVDFSERVLGQQTEARRLEGGAR